MIKKSLVRESQILRDIIIKRLFEDLEIKQAHVIKDAVARGFKISNAQLSKYLHTSGDYSLSEEAIRWICYRYGVDISLTIGKPVLKSGTIDFKIQEYHEGNAIRKLKLHFPRQWELKKMAETNG